MCLFLTGAQASLTVLQMSSHNSLSPSKAGDVLEHVIDDGVRLEDLKLHVVSKSNSWSP